MSDSNCDAIIIGAGVVGLFVARSLAGRGLRVTLLERGWRAGGEASWAGAGILSPLYPWRYPSEVVVRSQVSQALYPGICEALRQTSGIDPEWRQSGLLILDRDEFDRAREWQPPDGDGPEFLTGNEVASRWPRLQSVSTDGGIWLPRVAQIRNPRLCRALAIDLRKRGVRLCLNTSVTQIRESLRGVVVSSPGQEFRAGAAVVCNGAWASELLPLDASGESRPVRGQMLLFDSVGNADFPVVMRDGTYAVTRSDGQVLVGSSVESAGFDWRPTESMRRELYERARQMLPTLSDAKLVAQWTGYRPHTTDDVPLIGRCPGATAIYRSIGHYRTGLTMAPSAAEELAELITAQLQGN